MNNVYIPAMDGVSGLVDIYMITFFICIACFIILFVTFIGYGFKLRGIRSALEDIVAILEENSMDKIS